MTLGLETGIPSWCVLSVVAITLLYWYGTSTHNTFKKMGIPYRKPLPFFGNLLNILLKPVAEAQKEVFLKYPSRTVGTFQGLTPIVESADVEFIKQITIKEFSKFTNRTEFFPSEKAKVFRLQLFILRGDHWKHVRSLLSPTFTSGKLKQMYPVIKNCGDKFLGHLKSTDSTPIVIKDFASGYTMDVIASTAFGMDIDTQSITDHPFVAHAGTFFGIPRNPSWLSQIKQICIFLMFFGLPDSILTFLNRFGLTFLDMESVQYFYDIVDRILSDEKATTRDGKDFISMCAEKLVDLKDVPPDSIRIASADEQWTTQGLTKDEVLAAATEFLSAGYETTASAVQFFLYSMAMNPHIQDKLYESITEVSEDGDMTYEQIQSLEYLDWCVSETLRMYPPIIRLDRVAKEDVTIQGIDLPKGQIVNFLPFAVHYNPLYWDNPEEFIPERFSPENRTDIQQYAFLPFGAGNRSCIARRLAFLEVKVAAVKLLPTFRFEKTSETPEPKSLKFNKLMGVRLLRTEDPLKISAIPRT